MEVVVIHPGLQLLTGAAQHGGLQIVAYPMKRELYEAKRREAEKREREWLKSIGINIDDANGKRARDANGNVLRIEEIDCQRSNPSMGLAAGGLMRQEIYADEYGIDAWDQSNPSRCFVHILNSEQWQAVTGQPTPGVAPTATDYRYAGLPWFEYYGDGQDALAGGKPLAELDSAAALGVKKGQKPLPENEAVTLFEVIPLGPASHVVQDGRW